MKRLYTLLKMPPTITHLIIKNIILNSLLFSLVMVFIFGIFRMINTFREFRIDEIPLIDSIALTITQGFSYYFVLLLPLSCAVGVLFTMYQKIKSNEYVACISLSMKVSLFLKITMLFSLIMVLISLLCTELLIPSSYRYLDELKNKIKSKNYFEKQNQYWFKTPYGVLLFEQYGNPQLLSSVMQIFVSNNGELQKVVLIKNAKYNYEKKIWELYRVQEHIPKELSYRKIEKELVQETNFIEYRSIKMLTLPHHGLSVRTLVWYSFIQYRNQVIPYDLIVEIISRFSNLIAIVTFSCLALLSILRIPKSRANSYKIKRSIAIIFFSLFIILLTQNIIIQSFTSISLYLLFYLIYITLIFYTLKNWYNKSTQC
ncbi:MAG: LptF/LptG family permease [Methylacidiphilales bacterium]|nr:LptF/LptG family permease [Candidatus Methylacidiphilales bacterium]